MQDESTALLRRYASDRSEAAFRELVQQHSGVVYGTALRQLGGDRAAAQDVMQEVFTLLVRKAAGLGDVVLSAWLYRQTCRRAANHLRTETRRRKREFLAVETMSSSSPASGDDSLQQQHLLATEIDRALLTLSSTDRDALILRFFENRNFRRVGETLGVGEEAARKRVTRALGKLTLSLKRRGILVTGATSLGSTMTGMAATQPPAAIISKVTAQALKSGAQITGAAGLLSLLKPFLAGLLATAATAEAWTVVQARSARADPSTSPATVAATRAYGPDAALAHASSSQLTTIDEVIAGIKRLQSAPAYVLTTLRMQALLQSLPQEQFPAFFSAADQRLTQAEKAFCYEPLVKRWISSDPAAAMTFAVDQRLGEKVGDSSGNLTINLFADWTRRDTPAAAQWLLGLWADENLDQVTFAGPLKSFFAAEVINSKLKSSGVDSALSFIQEIPVPPDRAAALETLTGSSLWHGSWRNVSRNQRLEIFRKVGAWPDSKVGRPLAQAFLQKWIRQFPDELRDLDAQLTPPERFEVSLGLSGIQKPVSVPNGDGTATVSYPAAGNVDFKQAQADALPAAIAAGVTRPEALQLIGESVLARQKLVKGVQPVAEWLALHPGEVNLDDALAKRMRSECSSGLSSDGDFPETKGIQWGTCLVDPALRLQLCRAAFRRLISSRPEAVEPFLERDDIPRDLVSEFRNLLSAKP